MRVKTKNEKVIDVLHESDLGDYKVFGARIRTYCPVHGGDHQKSLSIDRSTGWGHCFNASCNAVVLIREFNPEVAERLLQQYLPHSISPLMDEPEEFEQKQPHNPPIARPAIRWQQEECAALLKQNDLLCQALFDYHLVDCWQAQAYLVTDDEVGEGDQQALVDVTDEEILKASFSRRAKEEHEALKHGRTWIGATDTLAERLPTFFTGPQPSIWKWRAQRQQVCVIGNLKVSVTKEPTVSVVPELLVSEELSNVALPVAPTEVSATPTPFVVAGSIGSDAVSHPSPVPPPPIIESTKERPLTLPTRPHQKSEKRREQSRSTLVFGNADHIQLVRLRRSKANAKRAVKKPRVQVEVKEIPAMVAEEQLPQKATSNKKTTYDQGQTLWDFLAQEPFPEPTPEHVVSPVLVVEPQQLTLF